MKYITIVLACLLSACGASNLDPFEVASKEPRAGQSIQNPTDPFKDFLSKQQSQRQ